jgi:hypothetical protein
MKAAGIDVSVQMEADFWEEKEESERCQNWTENKKICVNPLISAQVSTCLIPQFLFQTASRRRLFHLDWI